MAVLITKLDGLSVVTGIHGGSGETLWKAIGGTSMTDGDWDAIEYARLAGGASAGVHTHALTEELWFSLTGCDEATLGEDKVVLSPGDIVLTGIGGSHGSKQLGEAPFAMLVIAVRRSSPRIWNGAPGSQPNRYHRINLDEGGQDDAPILGVRGPSQVRAVATGDLRRVMGAQWRSMAAVRLDPGASLGPRKLEGSEAFVFLREGAGTLVTEEGETALDSETSLTFTRGSDMHIKSRGDVPLRLFIVELGMQG